MIDNEQYGYAQNIIHTAMILKSNFVHFKDNGNDEEYKGRGAG